MTKNCNSSYRGWNSIIQQKTNWVTLS